MAKDFCHVYAMYQSQVQNAEVRLPSHMMARCRETNPGDLQTWWFTWCKYRASVNLTILMTLYVCPKWTTQSFTHYPLYRVYHVANSIVNYSE